VTAHNIDRHDYERGSNDFLDLLVIPDQQWHLHEDTAADSHFAAMTNVESDMDCKWTHADFPYARIGGTAATTPHLHSSQHRDKEDVQPALRQAFARGKSEGWEQRAAEGLTALYSRISAMTAQSDDMEAQGALSRVACDSVLLFDSGANVSVMKNIDLFGSLTTDGSGMTTSVTGINKGMLELWPGGKLRGPFSGIDAKYCPEASANILCQADVVDHYWVQFRDQGMSTERYEMVAKDDRCRRRLRSQHQSLCRLTHSRRR